MDNKRIEKAFEQLNIPSNSFPSYTNANDFAKNFKKCSVLKDVSVFYSSSSTQKGMAYNNK
ncbi:hypothetical protein [Desulfosporosinus sp. FKA]|uniref:hypothetical protein n=1 Tax=Desulfosporosinus sp. FKA TaxID=1969834 RepID=UPI000B4A4A9D|nr:hypothetical protein [Desulfosporosinus sp. FKA]